MATWKKVLIAGDVSDTHIGNANKTINTSSRSLTLGDASAAHDIEQQRCYASICDGMMREGQSIENITVCVHFFPVHWHCGQLTNLLCPQTDSNWQV